MTELLKDHGTTIGVLKQKLLKAQERMKHYADKGRTDRTLEVGDYVYLKLQPYRQLNVTRRANQKLASKFYGPFRVLQKVGTVAYRLELPMGSSIHPVFHVSQLKKRVGSNIPIQATIPLLDSPSNTDKQPEAILDRRSVKKV